jgi:metal-responsive CopG/Arc/MetJ family transcriptional regulator
MKIKTSVTLSDELLLEIDRLGKDYKNRSDFVEKALRDYVKKIQSEQQNRCDIEIINIHSERLNSETDDSLSYQETW